MRGRRPTCRRPSFISGPLRRETMHDNQKSLLRAAERISSHLHQLKAAPLPVELLADGLDARGNHPRAGVPPASVGAPAIRGDTFPSIGSPDRSMHLTQYGYAASIAAGLMVHQFSRRPRALPLDYDSTLDLLAAHFTVSLTNGFLEFDPPQRGTSNGRESPHFQRPQSQGKVRTEIKHGPSLTPEQMRALRKLLAEKSPEGLEEKSGAA